VKSLHGYADDHAPAGTSLLELRDLINSFISKRLFDLPRSTAAAENVSFVLNRAEAVDGWNVPCYLYVEDGRE
jgi:hypothetical protein